MEDFRQIKWKNIGYKKKESQRPTATIGSEKRFDWQVEKWQQKTNGRQSQRPARMFVNIS